MTFSKAFQRIRDKNVVMFLPNWSHDVKIRLQDRTEVSKMTHPYLYVESCKGKVPWMPTIIELFSDEWEVI